MENSEITFVIQGQIGKHNIEQIKKIKSLFSGAKIVVSASSEKIDVEPSELGADEIVLNPDAGMFVYEGSTKSNLNRQLASTLGGLKKVKTKYAFKLRADFALTGRGFLDFFEKYPLFDEKYKVFDHKVLACSYFSRNPRNKKDRMPFHPSDLAYFGLTSDLLKIFDIPLVEGCEKEAFVNKYGTNLVSEQYIFTSCLKSCGKELDFKHKADDREKNIEDTEKYFASNFVFLSYRHFNIMPEKKTLLIEIHPNAVLDCYTHNEWMELYKTYLDKDLVIPELDLERDMIKSMYKKYKKYRLLGNILSVFIPNKNKKKKFRNFILEFFLS